MLNPSHS